MSKWRKFTCLPDLDDVVLQVINGIAVVEGATKDVSKMMNYFCHI